jgi:hypothetical protein
VVLHVVDGIGFTSHRFQLVLLHALFLSVVRQLVKWQLFMDCPCKHHIHTPDWVFLIKICRLDLSRIDCVLPESLEFLEKKIVFVT